MDNTVAIGSAIAQQYFISGGGVGNSIFANSVAKRILAVFELRSFYEAFSDYIGFADIFVDYYGEEHDKSLEIIRGEKFAPYRRYDGSVRKALFRVKFTRKTRAEGPQSVHDFEIVVTAPNNQTLKMSFQATRSAMRDVRPGTYSLVEGSVEAIPRDLSSIAAFLDHNAVLHIDVQEYIAMYGINPAAYIPRY